MVVDAKGDGGGEKDSASEAARVARQLKEVEKDEKLSVRIGDMVISINALRWKRHNQSGVCVSITVARLQLKASMGRSVCM